MITPGTQYALFESVEAMHVEQPTAQTSIRQKQMPRGQRL